MTDLPIVDYKINDLLYSISFNHLTVFEVYNDRIESFAYLLQNNRWNEIVKFHRSRCKNLFFSPLQVREVGHIHDHFLKRLKPVVSKLLLLGVRDDEILFITNYHSLLTTESIQHYFNSKINVLFLRYFELESVLKHRSQQHQAVDTVFNYEKKYLALFGKPRKFMRSGALIKLHKLDMITDTVYSSLAVGSEIEASVKLAEKYWPKDEVKLVLEKYSNIADDINYDTNGDSETNYAGYPYCEELYKSTFCSLIAETNDIEYDNNNATSQFFITEKFARAVYNFHPFVVLSVPYFLKNIKDLGYETFSSFASEDYDEMLNPYHRLESALNSIREFPTLDKKILDVVTHNFTHINNVYNTEYQKLKKFLER